MSEAKIRLSQKELELVSNADWILTKNAVLQKVNQLLGSLQPKQQKHLELYSSKLPGEVLLPSPKISKGENYNCLPYLILDYPRFFEQENLPDRQAGIFAIRTMFWWGNFFSLTLHLSGLYKKMAEQRIITSYKMLKENGFFCCINNDQWEHHFEANNYMPLTKMSNTDFENLTRKKSFIKLANKIPLQHWDDAEETLLAYFKQIIGLLAD